MRHLYFTFIFAFSIVICLTANDTIDHWLISPVFDINKPAFSDIKNTQGNIFKESDLLGYNHHNLDSYLPENGRNFLNTTTKWTQIDAKDGQVIIDKSTDMTQMVYLCSYIWAEEWVKFDLELKSNQMLRVWLDDKEIGIKTTVEANPEKPGKFSKELKLEQGRHKLIIKSVHQANDSCQWNISAKINTTDSLSTTVFFDLQPVYRKTISHILDGTRISNVKLSYDGKYYVMIYSDRKPGGENSESWIEIKRTTDNSIVYSFKHARVSSVQWLPASNRLSYISSLGKERHLYILDVEKLTTSLLFVEGENLGSIVWTPNEKYVIYYISEPDKSTDSNFKQIQGMADRQKGYRTRSFLNKYNIETSEKIRLTYGNLSTWLNDISPDSKKILFSNSSPDYTERPFSKQNMYVMDLETFELDTLWTNKRWSVQASFSPDGNQLLCSGGPSAFGKIGENIEENQIANNYDTQLYIYDLKSKQIDPITYDFNPSVSESYWSKIDKNIYIGTTEEDYRTLYRYNVSKKSFTKIDLPCDHFSNLNFAKNALLATFKGSNVNSYPQYYLIDLKTNKIKTIENIEQDIYKDVVFGDVQNWNFTTSSGVEIKGRVYFPPDFDSNKKYPVIVYYYGGTTPVGRTFAGRYPYNLWAGNGYLVYVLQPSGAIGFGQKFSAEHVNNWGKTVAGEIVEGTQKFLTEHPYADTKNVGCVGASYGGFMTMYLLTQTDIFKAAVSHAGISSISSYWGEGYWGYAYSAEASADSYPWNNKELYIEQSPLFNADKIHTPLLLLTGDSDTNVPPGESIQLYTALKILDRPVELVTFKGEDHHIMSYKNRIIWHNTIMAWWDMQLKGHNAWWNELYPEKHY